MILSRKFVSDYIDLDNSLTIKQIAEDMTRVGNEYDNCGKLIEASNLVIGEIIECVNHPDSDHLHVCKVNIGNEVLQIVCGAPNARVGIKVIVALVGAVLPEITIKKGVIRGVESNGMMCSMKELGLDNKFLTPEDINGIKELPDDANPGEDPIKYLGLDDEIIDFELTANRGDLLSMLGLSYELGAIYDKKVKDIDLTYNEIDKNIESEFSIDIKTEKCSLFLAKKVSNITIKESPDFIKNRLIACGIRPINNVVDISNYVMLETGQPLHFYDADNLGDTLIVRDAKDGEKLVTLDNQERTLTSNDIVIANKVEAVGLAGVMGGLSTEVLETTKNIIIESAIFDSVSVRKTSKKVLRSEASNRFEKGIDPKRTYMAIKRACHLLEIYANGSIYSGMLTYDRMNKDDKVIDITLENINNVLGTNIDVKTVISVFEKLGFTAQNKENLITVTVPTRRTDISIKEDLIEEVGRIYGINNIEGKLPKLSIKQGSYDKTTRQIRNKLVDLGLNEVLTQIFLNDEVAQKYCDKDYEIVKLLDPLSVEKNALRYSLVPSLLKVYEYNKGRNLKDITIFEMAKGFYKKDDEYGEDNKLSILMTGDYYLELGNRKKVDFYVLKGIIEELLHFLGFSNRYSFVVNNIKEFLHPGVSATINVNGFDIGFLGLLHPSIEKNAYVAEINLDKLLKNRVSKLKYKEVSKYPKVVKDLAFIVDKKINSEDIVKVIKKSGGKTLTNIEVFDLYTGENVKENEKSIAYSLTFEDMNKTLSDEEVMLIFNKIINDVEVKLNAKLRDK